MLLSGRKLVDHNDIFLIDMKKLFFTCIAGLAVLYILICGLLFFFQEKLIFVPAKLDSDYVFDFPGDPEEVNIETADDVLLNGLLFRADSSKGVILYLHGNGGSLASWGMSQRYIPVMVMIFLCWITGAMEKAKGK